MAEELISKTLPDAGGSRLGQDAGGIRPLCIDFGAVDDTCRLDALITAESAILEVRAEDPRLELARRSDRELDLVLNAEPGQFAASVTVVSSDKSAVVEVRADVASVPPAQCRWPATIHTSDARGRLSTWAEGRRFVPKGLLEDQVFVRPIHVVHLIVESLVESLEEASRQTTHEPDAGRFQDLRDVPDPTEWGDHTWRGTIGTPLRKVCQDCDKNHTVVCNNCSGTGRLRCRGHRNTCSMCGGRGLVVGHNEYVSYFAEDSRPRKRCPGCNGSGRGVCPRCQGSGYLVCPECNAGRRPCPTCEGLGHYFRFVEGTVSHRVVLEEAVFGPPEATELLGKRIPWQPLSELSDDLVGPDAIEWLEDSLGGRYAGEIARRTRAELCQVFALEFAQNSEFPVYLLGPNLDVRAPNAGRRLLSVWKSILE